MKTSWWILLLVALLPGLSSADPLPNLGSPERAAFSSQAETELGQEFMIAVRNHFRLEQDPLITEYVTSLGQRLAAHSDNPRQHFYFFVISNPGINAFAGPNGYIGVYTGTITAVDNEAELASVLAHEIGHVNQEHFVRGMAAQKKAQYQQIVGMILGAVVGSQNPQAGAGIISGAQAAGAEQYFAHSQAFEKEADRVGMKTMAAAGYPPAAMPQFFKHLVDLERYNTEDHTTDLLRTHPLSTARLADAENRAKQFPVKLRPQDNLDLQLLQVRILVSQSTTTQLKNNSLQETYARALLLVRSRHYSEALAILHHLQAAHPHNTILRISQAEIEFEAHHIPEALNIMAALYQAEPENPAIFLYDADMLIKAQKYQAAISLLKASEAYAGEDELYLYLLSQALGKSGQLTGAYELRAKLYQLYGNLPGARLQLNQALKYAQPYDRPRIERELENLKNT